MTFDLTIKTPLQNAINHEAATELHVDTEGGRIAILPGHASLTGSISFSKVLVREKEIEKEFFVRNGIVYTEVGSNKVTLLCMSYEETHEVSMTTVKEYLDQIEQKLKNHESLNDMQIEYLEKEKLAFAKHASHLDKSDDHLTD